MSSEIVVTLYWVREDAEGRLVARRRMRGLDEFWASGKVAEYRMATVDADAQSTAGWRELLAGLRLPEFTVTSSRGPVALRLLDTAGLRTTRAGEGSGQQASLLARASMLFTDAGGVQLARRGHLRASSRELVASPLLPVLRQAMREAGMTAAAGPPGEVRARAAEPSLWQGLDAAIQLSEVRGAQIGDHNLQINRFFVRGPAQRVDFEPVLLDARVRDAQMALLADPANAALRADLVAALRAYATAWTITADPLVLSAETKPPGFLERLLTFSVQGVQEGNWNTQRNSFECYATDVPAVDRLLHQDRALATALADYLCPATGRIGDLGAFHKQLNTSMREVPVEVASPHGVKLPSPGPGGRLFVQGVDGLTIGERNRVREHVHSKLLFAPQIPVVQKPAVPLKEVVEQPQHVAVEEAARQAVRIQLRA